MNSYKTRLKMGAVGVLILASLTACSSMPTSPASSSTPQNGATSSPSTPVRPSASSANTSSVPLAKVSIPATMKETFGDANASALGLSGSRVSQALNTFTPIQEPGFNRAAVKELFMASIAPAMTPEVANDLWRDITDSDGSNLVPMTARDAYEVEGTTYRATSKPWQFAYGQPRVEDVSKSGSTSIPAVEYSYAVRNYVPVKDAAGAERFITFDVTRSYTLQPGPDDATPWLVNGISVSDRSDVHVVDAGEVKQ